MPFSALIEKIIAPSKATPLLLSFNLGMDKQGRHTLQVFTVTPDGVRHTVDDPLRYARYGYCEQTPDGVRFVIEEHRRILASVLELNPKITAGGLLRFDITPGVLRFLRSRIEVQESGASRQVKIGRRSLSLVARVGYNPDAGILRVATGYASPDAPQQFLPANRLPRTPDGYVRSGNLFVPAPSPDEWTPWLVGEPVRDIPRERIPRFILTVLPQLEQDFRLEKTAQAARIQVFPQTPQLVARIDKEEHGELCISLAFRALDGRSLAIRDVEQIIASQPRDDFYQVDDYTWMPLEISAVRVARNQIRELPDLRHELEDIYHLPIMRFASVEEKTAAMNARVERGPAYQDFLNKLSGFEAKENYPLPGNVETHLASQGITLRPYQRSGIHWLRWLAENSLNGILADDMGLGKTMQTVCAMRLAYEAANELRPSLVIAPKSVLHSWMREINRCFPEVETVLYHGTDRRKLALPQERPYILITTYETAVNDQEKLRKNKFFYIVLDEATKIKNPQANRTRAIKSLWGSHRLCLSGTPVENRPGELWSLFDFLMQGYLGKYGTFKSLFEDPILKGDPEDAFEASTLLGQRVRPFLLRRKKSDVAKDLPEKIHMEEWVELTQEQKQLYKAVGKEMESVRKALERGEQVSYTGNILPLLTKMKQICDHPAIITKDARTLEGRSEKFDRLVEMLREITAANEQAVVFSHFLGMLSLFERSLKRHGITYIRIDGSTDNRQVLIDRFNNHEAQVALLSLHATGYGITLTAANHVLHGDRWWNPAVEAQATDRVHRIGQEKTVYVRHVLVQNSIEERIAEMLAEKEGMSEQIMGAARAGGRRWSRDELLHLLRPFD